MDQRYPPGMGTPHRPTSTHDQDPQREFLNTQDHPTCSYFTDPHMTNDKTAIDLSTNRPIQHRPASSIPRGNIGASIETAIDLSMSRRSGQDLLQTIHGTQERENVAYRQDSSNEAGNPNPPQHLVAASDYSVISQPGNMFSTNSTDVNSRQVQGSTQAWQGGQPGSQEQENLLYQHERSTEARKIEVMHPNPSDFSMRQSDQFTPIATEVISSQMQGSTLQAGLPGSQYQNSLKQHETSHGDGHQTSSHPNFSHHEMVAKGQFGSDPIEPAAPQVQGNVQAWGIGQQGTSGTQVPVGVRQQAILPPNVGPLHNTGAANDPFGSNAGSPLVQRNIQSWPTGQQGAWNRPTAQQQTLNIGNVTHHDQTSVSTQHYPLPPNDLFPANVPETTSLRAQGYVRWGPRYHRSPVCQHQMHVREDRYRLPFSSYYGIRPMPTMEQQGIGGVGATTIQPAGGFVPNIQHSPWPNTMTEYPTMPVRQPYVPIPNVRPEMSEQSAQSYGTPHRMQGQQQSDNAMPVHAHNRPNLQPNIGFGNQLSPHGIERHYTQRPPSTTMSIVRTTAPHGQGPNLAIGRDTNMTSRPGSSYSVGPGQTGLTQHPPHSANVTTTFTASQSLQPPTALPPIPIGQNQTDPHLSTVSRDNVLLFQQSAQQRNEGQQYHALMAPGQELSTNSQRPHRSLPVAAEHESLAGNSLQPYISPCMDYTVSAPGSSHESAGPAAKVRKLNEPEKHHSMSFDKVHAKVVAGYVETMHVHNSQKEGPVPEEKRAEYINEFLDICNEEALARTEDKVTSTFENLKSPEEQVHPNYVVTNYFKGDTCLESDEYRPDPLYVYHTKRHFRGKKVKIHQFMDDANYVALVAEAGAGKTTAAKRFAQKVLKKQIPSLEHIELVHFVTFAELDDRKEHTVFDLLFSKVLGNLTDESKKYGSLWVQQNPDKILFIMDGLDQVGWTLDHAPAIEFCEAASVPIILQNVLTNDRFLHGCKVLITSREHAVKHFTSDVRPQKTISLTGLSAKDREYLIRSLSGEQGQAILDHLWLKAPGLYSLCETPLFLVFSVAVLLENFENAPETLSGILIRVLVYFINSEHQRVPEMLKIFSKLKKLAFDGTNEKKVLFEESEITSLDLNYDQIHDLVIVTPCRNLPLFFKLMCQFHYLFFCHQSIQEALAALYICDLPPAEFKEFLDRLHDPHFGVVRRIVLGVLLNPDNHVRINKPVLDTVCDRQKKKAVLGQWLADIFANREKIQKDAAIAPHLSHSTDIELCPLLNECGQSLTEILPEAVTSLDFTNKVVKEESLYSVSSVVSRLKEVKAVKFGKLSLCELNLSQFETMSSHCGSIEIKRLHIYNTKDPQVLEPLLDVIEGKDIKVGVLSVHIDDEFSNSVWIRLLKLIHLAKAESIQPNKCVTIKVTRTDGQLVETSADLLLLKDQPTIKAINTLTRLSRIPNVKLVSLDLKGSKKGSSDVCRQAGELAKIAKIDELSGSLLTADHVRSLREGISGFTGRLKSFHLVKTYPSPEACHHVGKIVKIASVEDLDLSGNHLCADHVCQLRQGLEGFTGQLKSFRLAGTQLSPEACRHVGEIVKIASVEDLSLSLNDLSADHVCQLREGLEGFTGQLKRFHLERTSLSTEACRHVGEIVKIASVEDLDLSCNHLCADHVCQLRQGLEGFTGQLKSFRLARTQLSPEACRHVGEIVKIASVEDLSLSLNDLSADHVCQLREGLEGFTGQLKRFRLAQTSLSTEACRHVGEIVKIASVEDLDLSCNHLCADHVCQLREGLEGFTGQLKSFRLARTDPSPEACRHAGEIVKIASVEDLSLCVNDLSAYHVCQLREGLEGFTGQLKKLDVSYNNAPVCSKELGEIVEMCQVEKLNIGRFPPLDGEQVKSFVSSLHKMRDKVHITVRSRHRGVVTGSVEDLMREYITPPTTCSQPM